METKRRQFGENLLLWRQENNPDSIFPWRNTEDPYEILVTECLLKKTTRTQVANMWPQFVEKFPDVYSLKKSDIRTLKKIIKPLGMVNIRTLMLKKLAQIIVENYNGKIPEKKEELMKLPGVGGYVANAVLCFAFNKDVSMIDTNVMRVLHRVFSLNSTKARPRTDKKLWEFVEKLPPSGTGRNFNLAILDFAGMVCKSKNPKCEACVMRNICDYYLGPRKDSIAKG
jgi:A/G-specific adenine glycosylase